MSFKILLKKCNDHEASIVLLFYTVGNLFLFLTLFAGNSYIAFFIILAILIAMHFFIFISCFTTDKNIVNFSFFYKNEKFFNTNLNNWTNFLIQTKLIKKEEIVEISTLFKENRLEEYEQFKFSTTENRKDDGYLLGLFICEKITNRLIAKEGEKAEKKRVFNKEVKNLKKEQDKINSKQNLEEF